MPDESALDDAYAALGVASTASELEITRAYLQLRRFAGDPSTDADAASIERAYAVVRAARGIHDPRENVTEQISVFADAPRASGRRARHGDEARADDEERPAGDPADEDARADAASPGGDDRSAFASAAAAAADDRSPDRTVDSPVRHAAGSGSSGFPVGSGRAWSDDDPGETSTRAYGDELAFLRGATPPAPSAPPWMPASARGGDSSSSPWAPSGSSDVEPTDAPPWTAGVTTPDDATVPISWSGLDHEPADDVSAPEARTAEIDEDARDTAPIPASAEPDARRSPPVGSVEYEARAAHDRRDDDTVAWTAPLAPGGAEASASSSFTAGGAAAPASPSMSERTRDLAVRAADGAAARSRGLAASALTALDERRRARRGAWTLGFATGPLRSSWTEADDLAADRRRLAWTAALAVAMIAAWLPVGMTALQTIVDYVQARDFELWTARTGIAVGEGLLALFLVLAARSIAAARGRVRGGAVLMMIVTGALVALAVWQNVLVALSLAPVVLFVLAFVARGRRRAWLAYEEERRGAELWERLVDGAAGSGRRLHWVIQAIPRYAGRQSEVLIETQGTSARETILLWGAHAPGRWIDIDRSSGSVVAWATDACRTSWDALESRATRLRERRERG